MKEHNVLRSAFVIIFAMIVIYGGTYMIDPFIAKASFVISFGLLALAYIAVSVICWIGKQGRS